MKPVKSLLQGSVISAADSNGILPLFPMGSAQALSNLQSPGKRASSGSSFMRAHILLGSICALCVSAVLVVSAQAQQNLPDAPSAKAARTKADDPVVEGTVVSTTRHTLVVRSDDNQYHLFTYDNGVVPDQSVKPGARVRVNGSAADDQGTQVAENVAVTQPASSDSSSSGQIQAAPPPPPVNQAANQIEGGARRWHAGGRIGAGFSPEIFLFGVQSQIGPFFTPNLIFRPNAEFGFGELTDMFALNLEGAYRVKTPIRNGWLPYFGVGPSLNFVHKGASSGNVSFGNFTYKTGFNVFLGAQKRHTFLEMKTALWSDGTPVLRLMVGCNF